MRLKLSRRVLGIRGRPGADEDAYNSVPARNTRLLV